jgi:hypothetical protein
MKVIVQHCETGAYLSMDGQWVAARESARDFFTLMRAYHCARNNAAGPFKVLLHCPDEEYSASIIDGVGVAEPAEETAEVAIPIKTAAKKSISSHRKITIQSHGAWSENCRFSIIGNPLN